mmetsp:Transcript_54907/g.87678  ORF Transcript_54907/g.87678 Transcript_54907/m.87678 type:complete len:185 (+) Transcript_54907:40-594(+)|eukprot:CAMPEP_0197031738 /NCGR_PEP_ID=MMETSP1384-20130603/10645_1 /TAXON_ID=29189 /ORGANISM="Ammonia sp." /LENGTH=184 /DNA_ID=CAMNT_0042461307 /DNA_START=40 /DNA_END=597 /DNA_ORIENTATION=-
MSATRTRLLFFGVAAAASSYYGYAHLYGKQAMSSYALEMKSTSNVLALHEEVWNTLRLSTKAQQELQQTIHSLHTSLLESGSNDSNFMAAFGASERQQTPLSYKEYIQAHADRFEKLGLSNHTKNELIASTRWVWHVLHDEFETYSDDDVERAQTIQHMMKQFGGAPLCCDDNIFLKSHVMCMV